MHPLTDIPIVFHLFVDLYKQTTNPPLPLVHPPRVQENKYIRNKYKEVTSFLHIYLNTQTHLYVATPASLYVVNTQSSHHTSTIYIQKLNDNRIGPNCCQINTKKKIFLTRFLLFDPPAIVVAVFGVCWAPFHIERLLWSSISQWTDLMHNVYQYVHVVSGVFFYLSSAVNPIIYSLLSTRFRECFRELVCSRTEDNSSVRDSPPSPKILLELRVSGGRAQAEGQDCTTRVPLLSPSMTLSMDTAILTCACKETSVF